MKNKPKLDPEFMPLGLYMDEFLKDADKPVAIGIERENGNIDIFKTYLHSDKPYRQKDMEYIERIVKFMLWSRGGFRIFVCGDRDAFEYIEGIYSEKGARAFDVRLMETVYERKFQVCECALSDMPVQGETSLGVGGFLNGCRIGLDIGGSNRKICSIIDGKVVYSATEPWQPVDNSDPEYHINALTDSMKRAAAALPRVDAVGISTAGIFVNNKGRIASIYRNVSQEDFKSKISNIYINVCGRIGKGIPISVANDGDIAALVGSLQYKVGNVVAISLGTSVAGGYIDCNGNITGRLNEFAFLPLDMNKKGYDEWSGDSGCCVSYISAEAVIRLGKQVGILPENEKISFQDSIKAVLKALEEKDKRAIDIYETIGCYLAHAVYTYMKFYKTEHVAIMGGVSAGEGGEILINTFRDVFADEYPDACVNFLISSKTDRTNEQSFAAATLVKL